MASVADEIGTGRVRVHKDRKTPFAAAQSIAAMEVTVIHTVGCGARNGFGSTSTWSTHLSAIEFARGALKGVRTCLILR